MEALVNLTKLLFPMAIALSLSSLAHSAPHSESNRLRSLPLSARYADLREKESKIEAHFDEINRKNLQPHIVQKRIREFLQALSNAKLEDGERQMILMGQNPTSAAPVGALAALIVQRDTLVVYVTNATAQYSQLFSVLDQYLFEMFAFFIDFSRAALEKIHAESPVAAQMEARLAEIHAAYLRKRERNKEFSLEDKWGDDPFIQMDRQYRRLGGYYNRYFEAEPQFGGGKDFRRRLVFQEYFKGFQNYLNILGDQTENALQSESKGWLGFLFSSKKWAAMKMLWDIPSNIDDRADEIDILALELGMNEDMEGRTPLFKAGFEAYDTAGREILNYEPILEGLENIPEPASVKGNVLNLYAPIHQQPTPDMFGMAQLNRGEYMTSVGAMGDYGLPNYYTDKVERSESAVFVGYEDRRGFHNYEDPTRKIMRLLSERATRNILIFPQGGCSTGLMDNIPIRDRFEEDAKGRGLLKSIVDAGYELNIIPITMPDNPQFMGLDAPPANESEKQPRRVIVHENINPAMVTFLRNNIDRPSILSELIRSTWLWNLYTNEERLLGQLRLDKAIAMTKDFVTQCAKRPQGCDYYDEVFEGISGQTQFETSYSPDHERPIYK